MVLTLTAWCILIQPASVFAQDTRAAQPPSLQEITDGMTQHFRKIKSLHVTYTTESEALQGEAASKRYLHVLYLVRQKNSFAFKGDKRYFEIDEPDFVDRIAPAVEPDFDVVPGGKEKKAFLDKHQDRQKEIEETRPGKLAIFGKTIVAFDGEKLRRKLPDRLSADIFGVVNLKNDSKFNQTYLKSVGMSLPDPFDPAHHRRQFRLPDAFEQGGYAVHDTFEEVDGFPCVVVSRPGYEKIWIDPQINYSVRKRLYYNDSGLVQSIRYNHDFAEIVRGIWLPQLCWWDLCAPAKAPERYRGKPLHRYVYTVTELSINNVPDSLFVIAIDPGMTVGDASLLPRKDGKNQFVTYVMPADKAQLEKTIQRALELRGDRAAERSRFQLGLWVNGIIVLAVAGVLLGRRCLVRRRSA
jgi:hypothetical protein